MHNDLWEIAACPVNGPSIAAKGDHVAVAWFTMQENEGVVKLAFSNDAGATFGEPVIVDDYNPIGRVDVILLESGKAFVVWFQDSGKLSGAIVTPKGILGNHVKLVNSTAARQSGFPILANYGNKVILAWTKVDSITTVRTTTVKF